jgi:hypothetical protein
VLGDGGQAVRVAGGHHWVGSHAGVGGDDGVGGGDRCGPTSANSDPGGTIKEAPLTGGPVTTLVTGQDDPVGVAVSQ